MYNTNTCVCSVLCGDLVWLLSLQLEYNASEGGEYPLAILMETVDTISTFSVMYIVCISVVSV